MLEHIEQLFLIVQKKGLYRCISQKTARVWARKENLCLLFSLFLEVSMIREILGSEFMDCHEVQKLCLNQGVSKYETRKQKRLEGIKTVEVVTDAGEKMWLWYDPQQIWEKYHA